MIILDAGHGGRDSGAVNPKIRVMEKDIVLRITLGVGRGLIRDKYQVVFTRDDDRFITLQDRLLLTRRLKPKLFISFHVNSVVNPLANGYETFIRFSKWRNYQNTIHSEVINYLRQYKIVDRGQKQGNYLVLNNPEIPSILVENLFIRNDYEVGLLTNQNFIEGLVDSYQRSIKTAYEVFS
ncbi:MAG: Sporulation-specific N-acetylmuramoyl-L-alanine amidase [candidate division WS2 bacterium]|nr:Sporulation-specific N-acetylmuramoyl-L-alanine amidase [Candidatus Lithacetigena glycinireducens]